MGPLEASTPTPSPSFLLVKEEELGDRGNERFSHMHMGQRALKRVPPRLPSPITTQRWDTHVLFLMVTQTGLQTQRQ